MNGFLHLFPSTPWSAIVKAYQMFLNLDFHELRKASHLRHSYTNDTLVQIYLTCPPSSSINLNDTALSNSEHCNTSRYTHGRCYTSRYHWHHDMTNTKKSIIPTTSTTFSYTVVIFVISKTSVVSEDYVFVEHKSSWYKNQLRVAAFSKPSSGLQSKHVSWVLSH
jgi:hypothetical protein